MFFYLAPLGFVILNYNKNSSQCSCDWWKFYEFIVCNICELKMNKYEAVNKLETEETYARVTQSERETAKPTQLQTRKPDPELATFTRPYLPFPATVSADLGTNRKLRIQLLFPCHLCRRTLAGTPAIEA